MKKRRLLFDFIICSILAFITGYLIYSVPLLFRFFNHELVIFLSSVFIAIVILITSIIKGILKKYNKDTSFSKFIMLFLIILIVGIWISNSLLSFKAHKSKECEATFITVNYDWSDFANCYTEKAIFENDETYCWAIKRKLVWKQFLYFSSSGVGTQMNPTYYRDNCFIQLARLRNNTELCKFVTNKNCLSKVQK